MKNEKLIRNAIVAATAVIIGILMIIFKETGLFYILLAAAIVFVIWGYIHEESLIDLENRIWARVKHFIRKNKKRRALGGNRAHGTMKNEQYYYNNSPRKSQIKERSQ